MLPSSTPPDSAVAERTMQGRQQPVMMIAASNHSTSMATLKASAQIDTETAAPAHEIEPTIGMTVTSDGVTIAASSTVGSATISPLT